MKGKRILGAVTVMLTAAVSFYAGRQSAPTLNVKLDNARVTITESLTPAGGRREAYTRPSDQIIVFVDEANYESIEASGQASLRHRMPGEIVWHSKGEAAPILVNKGKAYRNLVIALK